MQRVTRPSGGIHEKLRWLPVSLHKKLQNVINGIYGGSNFDVSAGPLPVKREGIIVYIIGKESVRKCMFKSGVWAYLSLVVAFNCNGAGLSSILEVDACNIAEVARETFDKYVLLFPLLFLIFHWITIVIKTDTWECGLNFLKSLIMTIMNCDLLAEISPSCNLAYS